MPRLGGLSHRETVPNRLELERELEGLETQVRSLEAELDSLPPAAHANRVAKISSLRGRITELRRILGR